MKLQNYKKFLTFGWAAKISIMGPLRPAGREFNMLDLE